MLTYRVRSKFLTIIYFIRHAQSDSNVRDEELRSLTQKGIEDSKSIPKIFSNIEIDAIISSPYTRCVQTLTPIAEDKNIRIELRNDLRERKIGIWFEKIEQFIEFAGNQWKDFDHKIDKGEALKEVKKRNVNEIMKIIGEMKDKTILIGTHGTALCTIMNSFDSKYGFEYFLRIGKKMPYIVKVEFEDKKVIRIDEIEI